MRHMTAARNVQRLEGAGRLSWQLLHQFYWNAIRMMSLEPANARGMAEDLSQRRPVDTSMGLVQQPWGWMTPHSLSMGTPLSSRRRSAAAHGTSYPRTSSLIGVTPGSR